ncbi:ribosome biogenesis ATPase-like protein RIX7 [Pseudomassariella vexata]|uniref:Peroxisomal ATPase PEX1 n=1 Tax=Pseudomassariella vexata TaxID=1141098 RepID=A0A1Y2E0H9_9PEZI|nr:ribosome biogenesis ATPase-like protein RIX7 [Pseudomassariella vexata]ORY64375.1 ribosome biogenesis ATPase-like protein RIX7 [Pseudomassariella vexata]
MANNNLDRDVYQIVKKYESQHEGKTKFTVSSIYDYIKNSNSSLSRQKKRPLEDSIERVLRLRKKERMDDEEDEAMDDAPVESPKPKERDYFLMNKHITKSWNVSRRERPSSPEPTVSTGNATPAEVTVDSAIVMADRQPNGEPKTKRRRAEQPKKDRSPPAGVSLNDLGGMGQAIKKLQEDVACPMLLPEVYKKTNPPRGVLLHGPPGCGKTKLANAFAARIGVPFIAVSAPSLVAGMSGETEKKIRELYEEARGLAPCLIFIDEIDAIMGKRDNAQREMEKRIVAQMLTCMDELSPEKTGGKLVVTLAATNRPDSIDAALRRAGRFNIEIDIGVPNEKARAQIFKALIRKHKMAEDLNLEVLAKMTPGFVGADLEDVVSVAAAGVAHRTTKKLLEQATGDVQLDGAGVDESETDPETIEAIRGLDALLAIAGQSIPEDELAITQLDLLNAIARVQPSAKREGFTTIPETTWAQVGALQKVREDLSLAIIQPIDDPERFARVGFQSPSGVLLWGPPGCGKTLLAKAVANEAKANFISVKGPELLNKYVGESERSIRQVFSRARSSAPCILFFDEIDALVPRRSDSIAESSARVVNMLLTELDGMTSRSGVYVIGATNRPDMIDPAILRPGRLGTNLLVGLPDADGRVDILKTRIKTVLPNTTVEELDQLDPVARRCEGFSGADLENLHIAAAKAAIKRGDKEGALIDKLMPIDWEVALGQIKPSVSDVQLKKFKKLEDKGWD